MAHKKQVFKARLKKFTNKSVKKASSTSKAAKLKTRTAALKKTITSGKGGFTRDNLITNKLVKEGLLPKKFLENVPQKKAVKPKASKAPRKPIGKTRTKSPVKGRTIKAKEFEKSKLRFGRGGRTLFQPLRRTRKRK